jgi:UDP-glucose 4-epimerase
MKILVTGGAGFIGGNLIKKLIKEEHDVDSLDNYSTGKIENELPRCDYYSCDIETVNTFGTYDKIYHLAALSRIQPSFNNPNETFRVNTLGTQQVLELARRTGAKVIYAGSSSRWHYPYQSPYASCKYMGEEICKMYKKTYGMDIEIARFYNVYGPNEIVDGDMAAVIGIWRNQIAKDQALTIVGDGQQRRDFTHVDDIVDGLYKIGFKNEKHEDAWELGTGINYSILEVFEMFKEKFNCDRWHIENQPGNYRVTLQENKDAQVRLGWRPKDRLKEYILNL